MNINFQLIYVSGLSLLSLISIPACSSNNPQNIESSNQQESKKIISECQEYIIQEDNSKIRNEKSLLYTSKLYLMSVGLYVGDFSRAQNREEQEKILNDFFLSVEKMKSMIEATTVKEESLQENKKALLMLNEEMTITANNSIEAYKNSNEEVFYQERLALSDQFERLATIQDKIKSFCGKNASS